MSKFGLHLLVIASLMVAVATVNAAPSYGENSDAGAFAKINGISLYYEVYGEGRPLLLIHANALSIASMEAQIEHFSKDRKVVVVDSRGHGKSGLGDVRLTYLNMMEDYNGLLDHLGIQSADVFGWSDGGIIALLLAIHHPDKVSKVAAMGANIRPDQGATEDWVSGMLIPVSEMIDEMIATNDESADWNHQRQLFDLLMTQPDISHEQLQSIEAPVLLAAGDMDIIRGEHTMEMFRNLRKGHLAILPGQTHWAPATDPDTFNALIRDFYETPFSRPTSQEILQKDLGSH